MALFYIFFSALGKHVGLDKWIDFAKKYPECLDVI